MTTLCCFPSLCCCMEMCNGLICREGLAPCLIRRSSNFLVRIMLLDKLAQLAETNNQLLMLDCGGTLLHGWLVKQVKSLLTLADSEHQLQFVNCPRSSLQT